MVETEQKANVLKRVVEGMEVYDLEENKIGTVRFVKFPERERIIGHEAADVGSPWDVVEAVIGTSDLPSEIQERLLVSGFLILDTGLLRRKRFILPDQIAVVSEAGVTLHVTRDDLVEV